MKKHEWSGKWPTDEYPADGTRIRYQRGNSQPRESMIRSIWCGIEPVIELENGVSLFSWDAWEQK